jgi:hypothetical protein
MRRRCPWYLLSRVYLCFRVLKSKQAVKVNIAIMRAFVQMRQLLEGNKELTRKINELEKSMMDNSKSFLMRSKH